MTLRIATVQAEARPGDIAYNAERAAEFVIRAGAGRADLVVFPETFLTGYDLDVFAGPLPHIDDPGRSPPSSAASTAPERPPSSTPPSITGGTGR